MKLIIFLTVASHSSGGETPESTCIHLPALLPDDLDSAAIMDLARKQARVAYPESDGWYAHMANWLEITQGHIIGAHRLTWSVGDATPSELL